MKQNGSLKIGLKILGSAIGYEVKISAAIYQIFMDETSGGLHSARQQNCRFNLRLIVVISSLISRVPFVFEVQKQMCIKVKVS